jgi:hypothetical protein
LTLQDFERHPLWGFDLDLAEEDPEADETWVCPKVLKFSPKNTDVLFLRAELRTADGKGMPGCLLLRYEGGKPEIQAVALLTPRYLPLGPAGVTFVDWAREDLEKAYPKSAAWFPVSYTASLRAGFKSIPFSGAVSR